MEQDPVVEEVLVPEEDVEDIKIKRKGGEMNEKLKKSIMKSVRALCIMRR